MLALINDNDDDKNSNELVDKVFTKIDKYMEKMMATAKTLSISLDRAMKIILNLDKLGESAQKLENITEKIQSYLWYFIQIYWT